MIRSYSKWREHRPTSHEISCTSNMYTYTCMYLWLQDDANISVCWYSRGYCVLSAGQCFLLSSAQLRGDTQRQSSGTGQLDNYMYNIIIIKWSVENIILCTCTWKFLPGEIFSPILTKIYHSMIANFIT